MKPPRAAGIGFYMEWRISIVCKARLTHVMVLPLDIWSRDFNTVQYVDY